MHLLAKSTRTPNEPRESELLAGHLKDVTRVARLLAESWGETYLTSLGLAPTIFQKCLIVALPRAALAHDWGKANDHFQRLLQANQAPVTQAGWHEQFSVWLALHFEELGGWLFQGCPHSLRHAILIAVLGHHLRFGDGQDIRLNDHSGVLHVDILTSHPDFRAALWVGTHELGLGDPPPLDNVCIDLIEPETFVRPLRRWLYEASEWWDTATREERRFTAALKALLITADLAGSAIPRMPADPETWAKEALRHVCTDSILSRVVEQRLNHRSLRPFQQRVQASSERVTFVRAGCGSGKTVAAYLWAAGNALGRKLFFCYPTTGTATQGFADYVPPDQFEATLVHSRAAADLEDLLTSGTADGESRLDWLTRYAALASWKDPITVCTADAVLGLIQNNRTGLFSFAPIAQGAFVFDEIHQYDDRLFGALLCFLETFRGTKILLLTASLPTQRHALLREVLDRLGERLEVIEGPVDFEAIQRYRLERATSESAWERVAAAVAVGQRVLWVANTVDRAIDLTRHADRIGLRALPYHSRYRYQDRQQRHNDVIQAFAADTTDGILAITTQVCEVSLDISAQLLVSDLAPIPALIQRLGRLNRRATPDQPGQPAPALLLEPPGTAPYRVADLDRARQWLELLVSNPVSQADLAQVFDQLAEDKPLPVPKTRSAWLDDGVLAKPAPLREEGVTIPVIREEDVGHLSGLSWDEMRRSLIRLTIPMPLGPVQKEIGVWKRQGGSFVAPKGRMHYDERLGGRWQ